MARPAVSFETIEDIDRMYAYYRDYEPNPRIVRIGHAIMHAAYSPHVTFAQGEAGVSGAEEVIGNELAGGSSFLLAMNHVSNHDSFNLASVIAGETVLRPMTGHLAIPGKLSIFQNPILRRLAESQGAFPVQREDDMDPTSSKHLQVYSALEMIETAAIKVNKGLKLGIFPEGTRNKHAKHIVQPVRSGVGRIYEKIDDTKRKVIVPIGIWYGKDDVYGARHAEVHIGQPLTEQYANQREVRRALQSTMQASLDVAMAVRG